MIIRIHYGCYNDKDNVEVDNAASMTAQIKATGAQHTLWGTEQRYARYFSERDTDHIYINIVYIYIYIYILDAGWGLKLPSARSFRSFGSEARP